MYIIPKLFFFFTRNVPKRIHRFFVPSHNFLKSKNRAGLIRRYRWLNITSPQNNAFLPQWRDPQCNAFYNQTLFREILCLVVIFQMFAWLIFSCSFHRTVMFINCKQGILKLYTGRECHALVCRQTLALTYYTDRHVVLLQSCVGRILYGFKQTPFSICMTLLQSYPTE